jgi:hypothetical protein
MSSRLRTTPGSGLRAPVVTAAILYSALFGYYIVTPSLERVGLPVRPLRAVWAAILLTTACHSLLDIYRRRALPQRPVLILALVPAAGLVTTIAKGEYSHTLASLISLTLITIVAYTPSRVNTTGLISVAAFTAGASVALATLDPQFAIVDRDFLPLVVSGRAFGLAAHPNTLGLLGGIVTLHGLSQRGRRMFWTLLLGVLVLLAAASQTAILATIGASVIILGARLRRRMGPTGLGLALVVGAASAYIVHAALSEPVPVTVDTSLTGRTQIWAVLLRQDVGWFGLTDGAFTALTMQAHGVSSAHNLWIQEWALGGPVGLAASIVAMSSLLITSVRLRSEALGATVVFLLVLSLTEGVLFELPLIIFFAVLVSWSIQQGVNETIEPRSPDRSSAQGFRGLHGRRSPHEIGRWPGQPWPPDRQL